jgi:hypothetical protein
MMDTEGSRYGRRPQFITRLRNQLASLNSSRPGRPATIEDPDLQRLVADLQEPISAGYRRWEEAEAAAPLRYYDALEERIPESQRRRRLLPSLTIDEVCWLWRAFGDETARLIARRPMLALISGGDLGVLGILGELLEEVSTL